VDDEACQPEFNPRRGQLAACTRQGSFRAGILAQELRGSLVNIDQINKEQQEGALSSLRVITSEAFGVALSKTYRFKLMVTDFLENDSEEVTKQLDGQAGLTPAVTLAPHSEKIYYNTTEILSADAALPVCMMEEV